MMKWQKFCFLKFLKWLKLNKEILMEEKNFFFLFFSSYSLLFLSYRKFL